MQLLAIFIVFIVPQSLAQASNSTSLSPVAAALRSIRASKWSAAAASRADPCLWPGILCEQQQIVEIQLEDEDFQVLGSLLALLPRLDHLRSLELASFSPPASGTPSAVLNPSLGSIRSLERLAITNAFISGSIPIELANLTKLQSLILRSNNLSGPIPPQLCKISSLQQLDLSKNRLDGEIPGQCLSSPSLATLNLARNRLSGRIPAASAAPLQVLDLSMNYGILGKIPPSLASLSSLVELRLYNLQLNGSIPDELGSGLHRLVRLMLQANNLTGQIPSSLGSLSQLEELHLQGNRLDGPIPAAAIANMTSLREFYLQANRLTGQIPPELARLPSLKVLDLGFNDLEGELPPQMSTMVELQWLLLASNRFSGSIPPSISSLPKLSLVDVSGNQLNSSSFSRGLQGEDGSGAVNHGSGAAIKAVAINAGGGAMDSFQADDGSGAATDACSWKVRVTGVQGSNRLATSIDGDDADQRSIYDTARIGGDGITYELRCLATGSYDVELHFAELEPRTVDAPGRRLFDVVVQGQLELRSLDVFAAAGGARRPLVVKRSAVVDDSFMRIEFIGTGSWNSSAGDYAGPMVSAIKVLHRSLSLSLSPSSSPSSSSSSSPASLWALLGSSIGILVGVCALLLAAFFCWIRRLHKVDHVELRQESPAASTETGDEESNHEGLLRMNNRHLVGLLSFDYADLAAATDKFSDKNLLGQGAYGKVYHGVLADGRHVAIKQLLQRTPTCKRWFLHELLVISLVRHRNLVPLIGCCIDQGFPLLVCEYMPKGNLQRALFEKLKTGDSSSEGPVLSWEMRYKIAVDVARGLQYLHEDSTQGKIIHRDVKPGNILLDASMNAHISDFGLAKLVHDHGAEVVVTSVMGTRGYLAPEYVLHGQLSEKVDVYSYGVVLLELVSGRRGMQTSTNPSIAEPVSIDDWAWEALVNGRQAEIADPRLSGAYPMDELVRLVQVALWCTQSLPDLRPSMGQVMLMLARQVGIPDLPRERISWDEFPSTYDSTTNTTIWASFEDKSAGYETALGSSLPGPKDDEQG